MNSKQELDLVNEERCLVPGTQGPQSQRTSPILPDDLTLWNIFFKNEKKLKIIFKGRCYRWKWKSFPEKREKIEPWPCTAGIPSGNAIRQWRTDICGCHWEERDFSIISLIDLSAKINESTAVACNRVRSAKSSFRSGLARLNQTSHSIIVHYRLADWLLRPYESTSQARPRQAKPFSGRALFPVSSHRLPFRIW
jgi:hypothetical protein